MHPDDCADLVADEVAALRDVVQREVPNVQVDDVWLSGPFEIFIRTRVRAYGTTTVMQQSPLILPGGRRQSGAVSILDLGARRERTLILHADCQDFDGQPPLADLLDEALTPLPPGAWPRDTRGRGIVADHPIFKRPFFCRPGVREFHAHAQHEDEPWDRYREGYSLHRSLLSIVTDLRTRFVV